MIEYLEQLVDQGKFREALKLAESVIQDAKDERELLAAYSAQLISYGSLQDEQNALAAGEIAITLARRLEEWDYFGTAALNLGVAYSRLGRFGEATERVYDYLGCLDSYNSARRFEAIAWFNLGTWYVTLGQPKEATKCLAQALRSATKVGSHRYAHGIRQALIEAYLTTGEFDQIPRLLVRCASYLRNNPDTHMWRDSWMFHTMLRAKYAISTNRLKRAKALTLRGLVKAAGDPVHECNFHLLLARVGWTEENAEVAYGHAMAARACAHQGSRPDLEAEATELLYKLTQVYPSVPGGIDRFYMSSVD